MGTFLKSFDTSVLKIVAGDFSAIRRQRGCANLAPENGNNNRATA
jgi:hypothetical protein